MPVCNLPYRWVDVREALRKYWDEYRNSRRHASIRDRKIGPEVWTAHKKHICNNCHTPPGICNLCHKSHHQLHSWVQDQLWTTCLRPRSKIRAMQATRRRRINTTTTKLPCSMQKMPWNITSAISMKSIIHMVKSYSETWSQHRSTYIAIVVRIITMIITESEVVLYDTSTCLPPRCYRQDYTETCRRHMLISTTTNSS